MQGTQSFAVLPVQVHAYAAAPGGRTAYLSELGAGQHVLVADAAGNARTAMVGRAKVEQRSLVRSLLQRPLHWCTSMLPLYAARSFCYRSD